MRDHISEYYLTVPAIGFALLGSWAIVRSVSEALVYRALMVASVLIYLGSSVRISRTNSREIWAHSVAVKRLLLGVETGHTAHPDKAILLEGADHWLFWSGVYGHPFRLLGPDNGYLTPESVRRLTPYPELGNTADHALPEGETLAGLRENRMLVYTVGGDKLRDITQLF